MKGGIKVRNKISVGILIVFLILLQSVVLATNYEGLEEIRAALNDGDGAELVVDTFYEVEFSGDTEFEKVLDAANWVAYHMTYVSDSNPPGDIWTSSDEQFDEITIGIEGSGTGDCEDFSILLCALMRFVIDVPAKRVWVQSGIVTTPGLAPKITPPIVGHAYIAYKAKKGGIFYIEPQWGGYPYRGSYPSVTFFDNTPPMYAGESAQLRFNDEWVKGGGDYLHNPNYID